MTTRLNPNNVEISSVTESQRDAISPKVAGMVVYNTTAGNLQFWDGTQWRRAEGALADAGQPLSISQSLGDGSAPSSTTMSAEEGTTFTLDSRTNTSGRYAVVTNNSGGPITFDMYVWGAGGNPAPAPGPGRAGAGGGMKGRYTLPGAGTITLVAAALASAKNGRPFPDGGNTTPYGQSGPGGGSSRVMFGTAPLPGINDAPRVSLLVGAGGGGNAVHTQAGTAGGHGGYPSGARGGGYYPSDGSDSDGKGATQNAGGAGGAAGRQPAGQAGAKYYGGTSSNVGGAGGGGGYYGGGGAGGYYSHGGGGSSWYDQPQGVSLVNSHQASPGASNHYAVPNAPDLDKQGAGTVGPTGGGYVQIKVVA